MSEQSASLQKRLGLPFAIATSVGSVIGSGIMRAPGVIANEVPDMWIALALWLAGGLYVLLSANVTAELTAALPRAGGHYVPVHEAFGDGLGLVAGWTTFVAYVAGAAAVALACADFLGMVVPLVGSYEQASAALILLVLVAANMAGVEEGRWIQIVGTVLKVGLLCAVIAIAFLAAPPSETAREAASPAIPEMIGFVAIVTAFQLMLGSYEGWYNCIYTAEEDQNPGRNMPRALFQTAIVVTLVYLAINASLFTALDLTELRSSDLPMALVIERMFGPEGAVFVILLAMLMALVTLNSLIIPLPRILFAMARDGLFFQVATRVNKGGTPYVALLIGAAVIFPLIFSGGYVFAFKLMAALAMFNFLLYNVAFFALRWRRPELDRPFRAIGYPILPLILMLIVLGLFVSVLFADPVGAIWVTGLVAICVPLGMLLGREKRRAAAA
ncbi:MAG: APC family permease [Pacificimonas sp.]